MTETKMGRKKLQMEEKSRALTLLEKGESVIAVARHIGVSREVIYQLKKSAASLSPPWDGSKTKVRLWRTKEDFSKNR